MDPLCGIGKCMSYSIPGLWAEEVPVCTTHFLIQNRQRRQARRRHPSMRRRL